MSDLNQIHTALERLFNEEGQRIVFWNDPDQEFQHTLPFVLLDGVTVLPMASVKDIPTIPGELFAKFQTGFYADPVDAVFKAMGVQ